MVAALLRGIFEEGANPRQLARGGRGAEALGAALGQERPQIGGDDARQRAGFDRFSAVAAEEVDESVRRRRIGPHRVRRTPPVMFEIGGPLRGQRAGWMVD